MVESWAKTGRKHIKLRVSLFFWSALTDMSGTGLRPCLPPKSNSTATILQPVQPPSASGLRPTFTTSSKMPTPSASVPQRRFRRGYMACVSCRLQKVRYDLGDEPPCAKCKHEHRDCIFESRKPQPRRREPPRWVASTQSTRPAEHGDRWEQRPQRDGKEAETTQSPPQISANKTPPVEGPSDTHPSLLEKTLGPDETLDLLSEPTRAQGCPVEEATTASIPPISPDHEKADGSCTLSHPPMVLELLQADQEALCTWGQVPFVQLGWFTAQEGLTYLDTSVFATQ